MLQAIDAGISPDGQVTKLAPVHLVQRSRAVVTILAPGGETAPKRGSNAALLCVLDSPEFASAEPGDPGRMEREIAADRDATGDRLVTKTVGEPAPQVTPHVALQVAHPGVARLRQLLLSGRDSPQSYRGA